MTLKERFKLNDKLSANVEQINKELTKAIEERNSWCSFKAAKFVVTGKKKEIVEPA